ncbi:MAG TPA: hypothetical protein VGH73_06650 [Thermoanaerobaculia bacterium]|jgi:hypothetical protein
MTKSYGKALAALGLATATVLSLGAPAFAGDAKPAAAGQKAPGAGMTAAVDAKGNLRQPTAAENRALAGLQGLTKSATGLQLNQWPDGTLSVSLADTFLNISMAQVQPDGSIQQVCVDSSAAADAVLATTPALEEK